MALSWCKMASNLDSHPKIRKAGRNGREVFLFALRRNAEPDNAVPGILPLDQLEPWYLADQLQMPEADAVEGLERCVTARLLARDGLAYAIVGWEEEWGKGAVPGRDRTAKWRENQKTTSPVTSPTSPTSRQSHGDARDALDQRRSEEKRPEETNKNSAAPKARGSRSRKTGLSEPTEAELAIVRLVLDKLGQHTGTAYSGADPHVRLVVNQLRRGVTEWDLRCVIGYCAHPTGLGWTDKPDLAKYLRPETLFGPQTIARYLDPSRAWHAKHFGAPPEPAPNTGAAA